MVDNYDNINIQNIINDYININVTNINTNLLNLLFELKNDNKCPAIIFQQNTISCLQIIRKIANDIDNEEYNKYPSLKTDRIKSEKKNKSINKKIEKETKVLSEKQEAKKMLDTKSEKLELIENELINAPHNEFIFNTEKFTQEQVIEWNDKFRIYFPSINGDFHFIIKLLWRGIGIYANGLPDNYLRLVQSLASKKKLAFVFSDHSLVFGVSMPFRTSVIYNDENCIDNLDPMIYHQMAGRAGRRGLDKEGNIVFIGYSWNRIKELSTCAIPTINGLHRPIYTTMHAKLISNNDKWYSVVINNLSKMDYELIPDDIWLTEDNSINNHQLMWNLRYSKDSLICNFLMPYLYKYFNNMNPSSENDQIEIAYFLSKFIHIFESTDNKNILPESSVLKINYDTLYNKINKLDIQYPTNIDGSIWLTIKRNTLIELDNPELRQRLFDFNIKIKAIQHYCYHTKYVTLTKLLGKLLTRIWWIYHTSSPIIRMS
jgi:hypothetical protein